MIVSLHVYMSMSVQELHIRLICVQVSFTVAHYSLEGISTNGCAQNKKRWCVEEKPRLEEPSRNSHNCDCRGLGGGGTADSSILDLNLNLTGGGGSGCNNIRRGC